MGYFLCFHPIYSLILDKSENTMRFPQLLILLFLLIGCSNNPKYEINENKYENRKEAVSEIERKTPVVFLEAHVQSKKNLLRQTVVRGQLYNKAKMITYKDVQIKLRFYSKTAAILEEDQDTIYDEIKPGSVVKFKTKYFTPKGTDSVSISIVSAKVVDQ